ncbi:MAG: tetratricopeptide repeat protein [Bacteroidia bacterium]|nr:tetratricopeptide repeat protein [Bacteroidia bacterium]
MRIIGVAVSVAILLAQGWTGVSGTTTAAFKTEIRGDLPRTTEGGKEMDKAVSLARSGKYEQALSLLERSSRQNPNDAVIWFWTGYCEENLGKLEEALNAYTKATEKKPDLAAAWLGRGTTLLRLERYEEAAQAFEKFTELEPKRAEGYFYLGAAHLLGKKPAEAVHPLEKALSLGFSDSLTVLVWIGDAYFQMDSFPQAEQAFRRAAAMPDAPGEAFLGWGKCRVAQNDPVGAIEPLDKAQEKLPQDPSPLYYEGMAYKLQGKMEEARKAWEAALQRKPDHARSLYELGMYAVQKGDKQTATQYYDKLKPVNARLAQSLLQAILTLK